MRLMSRIMSSNALIVALTVLMFTALACGTDEQKIKNANEAASSEQSSTNNQETERISTFDLRTGDCYNDPELSDIRIGEIGESGRVDLVPCTSDYQFRLVESIVVDGSDGVRYPGYAFFEKVWNDRCPLIAELFLYPTDESWGIGDRVVSCLEER